MIRTVNRKSTLTKMTAELSQRLRHSTLHDCQGGLLIADSRERVMLCLDQGKVQVGKGLRSKQMVREGEEIAQLLIGSADPLEIVELAGMHCTGKTKFLLRTLFPRQHPMLSEEGINRTPISFPTWP